MKKKKAVDKATKPTKKKKKEVWSHSIRKGDTSKRMEVEELDNGGYLVSVSVEGPDKKGDWQYDTKKMYSKTNPLDDVVEKDPLAELGSMLIRDNQ